MSVPQGIDTKSTNIVTTATYLVYCQTIRLEPVQEHQRDYLMEPEPTQTDPLGLELTKQESEKTNQRNKKTIRISDMVRTGCRTSKSKAARRRCWSATKEASRSGSCSKEYENGKVRCYWSRIV